MKKDIQLAIITATLALLGSAVGAYLSFQLSLSSWNSQITYEQRDAIVQKRIELIERFAKAVSYHDEVQKNIDLIQLDAQARLAALDRGETPEAVSRFGDRLSSRNIELEAEYVAVLTLAKFFFGPNTNQALNRLIQLDEWYAPPEADVQQVYEAMGAELYWFKS